MSRDHMEIAFLMSAICLPHGNPVAWVKLERAGIDRDTIQNVVDAGDWQGPLPDFARYPDAKFKAVIEASLDAKETTT